MTFTNYNEYVLAIIVNKISYWLIQRGCPMDPNLFNFIIGFSGKFWMSAPTPTKNSGFSTVSSYPPHHLRFNNRNLHEHKCPYIFIMKLLNKKKLEV